MLESLRWDWLWSADLSDIYVLGVLQSERVIGHMFWVDYDLSVLSDIEIVRFYKLRALSDISLKFVY
jgi:hypothetical protein